VQLDDISPITFFGGGNKRSSRSPPCYHQIAPLVNLMINNKCS
jgi:hypothetical protein